MGRAPHSRVFIVQPCCRRGRQEELTPIRPRPSIGHRQHVRLRKVCLVRKLVFKVASPDRLAACAISERFTSLYHLPDQSCLPALMPLGTHGDPQPVMCHSQICESLGGK